MAQGRDSETKVSGTHGRPKRWTGTGPRPARHIPWPELFKHHQSVLTGHLKMMDMVRKHCVEGTGNYDTAKACVDRTHEMIRMFKQATWNFVPPKDNIDRVPLGASSASMYPGYSPADHIYGEAAQEYGEHAAELKRKGVEMKLDPNGPQYVVGQNKKPRRLSQEPEQSQSVAASSATANTGSGQDGGSEPMEGVEQSTDQSQYFMIDSKPTPVAEMGEVKKHKHKANDKAKRRVSFQEVQDSEAADLGHSDATKSKKRKIATNDSAATAAGSRPEVQEEDISAEVEARLKAKEEKRKRKEEKKRKRESRDSLPSSQTETFVPLVGKPVENPLTGKPQKKMRRTDRNDNGDAAELSEKANQDQESEKKEKKKKKEAKEVDADGGITAAS